MGGVDLSDMLISLYRTNFKTKRWYLKVLFHCIDIYKVNACLLYRRHSDQMCISAKQQLSLLKFTSIIASSLTKASKAVKSVGRPSKRSLDQSDVTTPSPKRLAKVPTPIPATDVRYDNVGHWPECRDDKRNCRLCKIGQSREFCSKYDICLCLLNARNWFCHYGIALYIGDDR